MKPLLEEAYGASFAPHKMGIDQIHALDGRVQVLYELVGASEKEHFRFCADPVQQLLQSVYLEVSRKEGKMRYIASGLEDAPLLLGLRRLEEQGCFARIVPVDSDGRIDLEQLEDAIDPRTALVSISWAHGLTGVVQPVEEIAVLCKERGILLHLDASYAVGKIPLSFFPDYLTFAGDKMHALKSSAALFVKAGAPLASDLSAGSIDAPSLVALSAAAQQSMLTLDLMGLEVARLRNHLEKSVLASVPSSRALFTESMRLPNVSVLAFEGVHQEALAYLLHRKNIFASIGGSQHQLLQRQLIACGCDEKTASSAISFSLSRMTTEKEIETAIAGIEESVRALRTIKGGL